MLKVEKAIAFTLLNGAFVRVETTGTGKEGVEAGPDDWNALDVKLIDRDGREQLLCSIEYEDMKGLRTLVYDDESAEPVFIQKNGFDGEIPAEDEGPDNCETKTYDCDLCCKNGECSQQGMDGRPRFLEEEENEDYPQR